MQIRAIKMNRWPYSIAALLVTLSAGLSTAVASSSSSSKDIVFDTDITQSKCVTTRQEALKTNTKASSPGEKNEENGNSLSIKITFDPPSDLKDLQPNSGRLPQTPWHTPAIDSPLADSLSNGHAAFELKK